MRQGLVAYARASSVVGVLAGIGLLHCSPSAQSPAGALPNDDEPPITPPLRDGGTCTGPSCDAGTGDGGEEPASTWSRRFGDASYQSGLVVATDATGVYVAGDFQGTLDLGGGVLEAGAAAAMFVAKLDPRGQHVWSKRFPSAISITPNGIAVRGGRVVVVGEYQGAPDASLTLPAAGDTDAFVVAFDETGGLTFAQAFGGAGVQIGEAVAFAADDTIVTAGSFAGTVSFAGGPALTSAGDEDIFVAALDGAGRHVRSARFGGEGREAATSLDVTASGDVLVAGFYGSSFSFGGTAFPALLGDYPFVAKLNATFGHVWSKAFTGLTRTFGQHVGADAQGNVYFATHFSGKGVFGGEELESAGAYDLVLARFDAGGRHLASERYGASLDQYVRSMAVAPDGTQWLTGSLFGSLPLGDTTLTSAGADDVFLVAFDRNGALAGAQRYGDAREQRGASLALGEGGTVVLTGDFFGTVDFGGGALTSAGLRDAYVTKLRAR
jgi:hypothetical protein